MHSVQANREKNKDAFMNTVAFSDGMGQVYSDEDHMNKCIKSISSDDNTSLLDVMVLL